MTWASLLERLAVLLNDVPTRVALAGLVCCLGSSVGLVWWVSRHYVGEPATGWQLTTWDKAVEAKDQSQESERKYGAEACGSEAEVGGDAC